MLPAIMEAIIRKAVSRSNGSFTETADRLFINVFTESTETEVNEWKIFYRWV